MECGKKMKWKRIVGPAVVVGALALALAGLVAVSAHARGWERGRHDPAPDRIAARMAERLGLSAEQKARIEDILTQDVAKRDAIRAEGRKKMESLRAETEKRFAGVLTPEQMEKLRALREERMDRRGNRAPRTGGPDSDVPGGPPPARD